MEKTSNALSLTSCSSVTLVRKRPLMHFLGGATLLLFASAMRCRSGVSVMIVLFTFLWEFCFRSGAFGNRRTISGENGPCSAVAVEDCTRASAAGCGWRLIEGCGWRLLEGYGWRLLEGYGWRLFEGCGWRLLEGCGWRLLKGCGWRLAKGCGWRLVQRAAEKWWGPMSYSLKETHWTPHKMAHWTPTQLSLLSSSFLKNHELHQFQLCSEV